MSGIIFIGIIGVWVFISAKLTGLLTKIVKSPRKKSWVYPLVFFLVFISPLIDEIIGGFQFMALCKEEAIATYDKEEIYDKTVYLKSADVVVLTGTILPTYKQIWKYADIDSNRGLISYVDIHSDGGWLSRLINFNSSHNPYFFLGVCSGDKDGYLFQRLNIKKTTKSYGDT